MYLSKTYYISYTLYIPILFKKILDVITENSILNKQTKNTHTPKDTCPIDDIGMRKIVTNFPEAVRGHIFDETNKP